MARFQGDINLEMIDDFLNPIGKPMKSIRVLPVRNNKNYETKKKVKVFLLFIINRSVQQMVVE